MENEPKQLTKEDLKQLETDLRGLKEAYQKELEREQSERDIQATKDSEQSKILADEAVKEAEAEKLKIESEAKEKKLVKIFDCPFWNHWKSSIKVKKILSRMIRSLSLIKILRS
ncbi:hypothetical protein GQR36_05340 [Enterococcus termitis]